VLLTQYCSGDKTENNEMGGACSAYGWERRGVYRVLVGKSEGKRPLGRPRRRLEGSSGSGMWGYALGRAG